ncbi:zinc-binding alcohol dehydrogenase family protein [Sinomicrobium pectinilyticum]|uniref:Zinc-binding alcohol dehydrogenase family protein n=1 Tax=Sinomicrobium pectinilyticum TaxID=1084421 RepID=A0A3N0ENK8_SINP1|nr:zinc-binding alcohol dehydrogenase family protein [Sinomicrobium pectinilyticum]RNL89470.1 zinc-binding alcohol dehydrogenase family protein [Sinomicrobium pectinilyticum]
MKYIVCETPGKFVLGDKDRPEIKEGHSLLKIHKVGICGTDLHAYAGNQAFFQYPRVLGHELAAGIIETGKNDRGLQTGDKVIVMPYISCGDCIACRKGKTNCCTDIRVLGVHADGGMQEEIVVRNDLLIPVEGLSYDEMAIVEPLAIGAHAIRRAALEANETVVVIGCGPIGLGIIKLAKIAGARVIAIDAVQTRLEFARNIAGADHVFHVSEDPVAGISHITDGDLATAVFDATGNKRALESGTDYMAHGGRYILVGLSKEDLVFNHPKIHAKETTLMCSRNATLEDFEYVIAHIREFPVEAFVTHRAHYTEMIANFDQWLDPQNNVIKAMVDFN